MKARSVIIPVILLVLVAALQVVGWWMTTQTPVPSFKSTWSTISFCARLFSVLLLLGGGITWCFIRYRKAMKWGLHAILMTFLLLLFTLITRFSTIISNHREEWLSSEYVLRGELHYADGTELYLFNFVSWIGVGDDHTRNYSVWVRKGWLPVMEYNRPAEYGMGAVQVDGKTYRYSITEKEFGETFEAVN